MPGRGRYWKVGGLNDEHIKEEDLTQALQTKVNAGGGDDPLNVAFHEDEFVYNGNFFAENATKFEELYNVEKQGTGTLIADQSGSGQRSELRLASNPNSLGNSITMSTTDIMTSPPNKGQDMNVKIVQKLDIGGGSVGFINMILGLMNPDGWSFANPLDPLADIIAFSGGLGFCHDPARSPNWLMFNTNGTIITTTVPVLFQGSSPPTGNVPPQRFEIDYKKDTDIATFKIDGNIVGTISSIKSESLVLSTFTGTHTTGSGDNTVALDYWSFRIEPRPISQSA